jgi:schlafen family protein
MSKWLALSLREVRAAGLDALGERIAVELTASLAYRPILDSQRRAWRWTARVLHEACSALPPEADEWLLLLEYAPPLVTARPDLVVVTATHVLAVELKTGQASVGSVARRQALGYAEDLYWYHPGTRNASVVPVLLTAVQKRYPTLRLPCTNAIPTADDLVELDATGFRDLLHRIAEIETASAARLDSDRAAMWLQPTYDPRPSIIDAAVSLVAATDDEGITAALADDDELERLTSLLVDEVHRAANDLAHRVLLLTGVPGAGKTLVGLRLAHDKGIVKSLRDVSSTPLFLSGNGPLVEVLVQALARNFVHRDPAIRVEDARRRAGSLVKLVHGFTREHLDAENAPAVSRVVVFDEGQRAWHAEQMKRKLDPAVWPDQSLRSEAPSEPEFMLEIMERQPWAVVVVLVGEGQEINTGETGAELWINAVEIRNRTRGALIWSGLAPARLLQQANQIQTIREAHLHLASTRRSVGASGLADWADAVLVPDAERARTAIKASTYRICVTRDLSAAREWLRREGDRQRFGLVASARAGRLRAYGIETSAQLLASVSWPNWFLDRPPSLEASNSLEIAATEFKCQGLELDYVGVCWSWDLVLDGSKRSWMPRRLNTRTARWSGVNSPDRRRYALNAYRVLLTRARSGLVIWTPQGSHEDPTRDPREMDHVYDFLQECGASSLD